MAARKESPSVPYVYLLRCADDSLYCGWTTDVDRRLAEHRDGVLEDRVVLVRRDERADDDRGRLRRRRGR